MAKLDGACCERVSLPETLNSKADDVISKAMQAKYLTEMIIGRMLLPTPCDANEKTPEPNSLEARIYLADRIIGEVISQLDIINGKL